MEKYISGYMDKYIWLVSWIGKALMQCCCRTSNVQLASSSIWSKASSLVFGRRSLKLIIWGHCQLTFEIVLCTLQSHQLALILTAGKSACTCNHFNNNNRIWFWNSRHTSWKSKYYQTEIEDKKHNYKKWGSKLVF